MPFHQQHYIGATSAYTFAYAYDAVGNRTTQTRTVTNTQVITSVYDNANRLTSVNGQAYTWDANGNLLNDGASQYVYDQANRVRVITQTTNVYNFKYNGSGDRLRRTFTVTNPSQYQALQLLVLRDDGAVVYLNGSEVSRHNMPSGSITYTTRGFDAADETSYFAAELAASALVSGTNVLAVEVHQTSPSSSDISFDLELVGVPQADTLIPDGAVWKYLDDGSNQTNVWYGTSFDDSGWASAPAQLGYGEGDEAKVVSYGPDPNNKYVTTYFRRFFTVTNASTYQTLTLQLIADDGAVVYLNGAEAVRLNMPSGPITYTTLAPTSLDQPQEARWFVLPLSPSFLVNGPNLIAVEVHQVVTNTTDLSFDVRLSAQPATGCVEAFGEQAGQVVLEAEHADRVWQRNEVYWRTRTDVAGYAGDGFVRAEPDTGVWNNSGFVTTSAELQSRVQFATTGVYTVWVRAWAENGNGNSWHIGLDGQALSTADRMTTDETNPQYNQWVWTNATTEEPVATVNITTTGVHTISVWVREDGVRLDKLVLTTNSVYTPTGTGPTESARTTTCSTTTYTNTTAVLKYGYDPLYRLVNANYVGATSAYTFAYAYDAVGNRTVQTRTVTNTQVITSVYDNANRLTSVNGQAYTWDANGNLLNDGASQYVYDQANRVRVITQTSNVYAFKYNGSGDRLRQLVNGTPTTYTLDLNNALVQVLNDGVNTYLYGNGRIAQYAGSNVDYFLPDALGSVRQLANSAGSVTLAQRYDPFGNPLSSAGSGTSVWAFAGEARDATGLEYLRARYYAPTQGRFTARDVWDGSDNQPMSYNAWLYVYANPVNMTDPSGLNPNCLPGQIGCGPEVTNWFVEEVRYWRAKVQREIEPYDLAICAAEEYKYYDSRGLGEAGASKAKKAGQMMFIYGGGFPYKVMDFNYADAPNSMGNSPSPRANNYPDARPADLVWQVPGGGSVTLCGTCIERSELGNFMLGYIAPFVGMSEQTVVEAAHAIGGANGTWDEAAIRFGARYALQNPSKAGPDERNQDANSLCAFLNQQGIGQMVDPYVRDYTPSRSPLHAGFDHYKDIGYWPPTSWGPPRKVGDADATPLTVGPGIIPNNQYQFHRWRLESWWPTWFTPSYYPENPIRTRVLPTP